MEINECSPLPETAWTIMVFQDSEKDCFWGRVLFPGQGFITTTPARSANEAFEKGKELVSVITKQNLDAPREGG